MPIGGASLTKYPGVPDDAKLRANKVDDEALKVPVVNRWSRLFIDSDLSNCCTSMVRQVQLLFIVCYTSLQDLRNRTRTLRAVGPPPIPSPRW